jgi:uncharacterized protein (DUF1810 family)
MQLTGCARQGLCSQPRRPARTGRRFGVLLSWGRFRPATYYPETLSASSADSFELSRFVEAQRATYGHAVEELKAGQKRSHWMWFIFPQVAGLGSSSMAKRYAIGSRAEAEAYLEHPLLGARLQTCVDALLGVEGRSAEQIMGNPDYLKLQSSITLFAKISPTKSRYERLLQKYYGGRRCQKTLDFLSRDEPNSA